MVLVCYIIVYTYNLAQACENFITTIPRFVIHNVTKVLNI